MSFWALLQPVVALSAERNGVNGLLAADQLAGQCVVAFQHQGQVDGGEVAVLYHHASIDHAGVNVGGGAEHKAASGS